MLNSVFGDAFREENMTGVPATHHSLRHVENQRRRDWRDHSHLSRRSPDTRCAPPSEVVGVGASSDSPADFLIAHSAGASGLVY